MDTATRLSPLLLLSVLGLLASCSSSSSSSSSSTSGGPSDSGGSDTGSGTDAGGDTGASGLPDVNGCTLATAEDHTSAAAVQVSFGGTNGSPPLKYAPACIKIATTTTLTFAGDFSFHPLTGGKVVNGAANPDPSSPLISPPSGTTATIGSDLIKAGVVYPYYCANHFASGMMGAIYVTK